MLALHRTTRCSARGTRAELAHDLGATAAGVILPLSLATIVRWHEVDLGPERVNDGSSFDHDLPTGSAGGNYGVTDFASIHSPSANWLSPDEVAGVSKGVIGSSRHSLLEQRSRRSRGQDPGSHTSDSVEVKKI